MSDLLMAVCIYLLIGKVIDDAVSSYLALPLHGFINNEVKMRRTAG